MQLREAKESVLELITDTLFNQYTHTHTHIEEGNRDGKGERTNYIIEPMNIEFWKPLASTESTISLTS